MSSQQMIIANRFTIPDIERDLLGRGGMGDVYRALDTHTGETVAVKALHPDVLQRDPTLLERFLREGEALRQLNHPNIVRMIAAVEENGCHYMVMEYVSGGSLQDLLAAGGTLPHERVIQIALDLADALTRAHRLGIIHRDIKPGNVLLAGDGTPRLADFGIAHIMDVSQLTQSGIVMGTIDYLSPEACKGEAPDERADIWSFGVLLFQLLSGQKPFQGDSMVAKLNAILTQKVPDLCQLAPNAPDALVDLIYRMLEKDSQQRIASIRLVGAELESILKGWKVIPPLQGDTAISRFDTPTPTTRGGKHNLPAQSTPFVGRQAELNGLASLLSDPDVRLVTLLGAGGMGKTRLALEAGTAQLQNYSDGVYFVALAPLRSVEAIPSTLAQVIGLSFHEGRELRQQLLDDLREKQMLLILDNFEHLLEDTLFVTEILQASPRVKVLCTSRIRLDVPGEQLFHLEGMDCPDFETPVDTSKFSAVKLFCQSARRIRPDFELLSGNVKSVTRICRMTGGMPLGILLAAAWVELLTPQEIIGEMQHNLGFLATEQTSIPERQRSMQAVFDYSWHLLEDKEKEVFCGLSVFRGGFTREAAQAVTGATVRELRELMDKSLLQRGSSGRFDLHELLRQYSEQKLLEAGKEGFLRQRHLEYYSAYAEPAFEEKEGSRQAGWLRRLASEIDNLHSALNWCLASNQAEAGLQLSGWLHILWIDSGYLREGQKTTECLLAVMPQKTIARARGLLVLSNIKHNTGDYEYARELAEESLTIAKELGDKQTIADATFALSWPLLSLNQEERSQHLLEKGIELYQELNQPQNVAWVVTMLGEIARAQEELEQARKLHEWSVDLHRKVGTPSHRSTALTNLGLTLLHFSELDRSQALLRESLSIEEDMGLVDPIYLMAYAFVANAKGQPLRAARLLGASAALRKSMGRAVDPGDRPDYESNLESVKAQLDRAAFESAWEEGARMTYEQAIDLALKEDDQEEGTNG